ncbi:MAG: PDZ domain-containing protein [Gemmatimonadaceae bacterium]
MIRTPILFSVTLVLAAGVSLPAQQREIVVRRSVRAEGGDSTERQLRRLERIADSLARLFNDEDRSLAERRNIGDSLDRTVRQIQELEHRAAELDGAPRQRMELRMAPGSGDRASTMMGRAFVQAGSLRGAMPRGWLGIVVSGTALEPRIENGELLIRYLTHPEIVSVEPSSPAERAGITPSDTLLAYDGRDVRDNEISITRLLRPNARVLVRIRRNGRTRDVPVTIADVPSRISLRTEMNAETMMPRGEPGFAEATTFPRTARSAPRYAPLAMRPAIAPLPPMTPMPGQAPTPAIIFGYGYNSVAGAQLAVVTEGLARAIGVQQGVLVTLAPPGSLAYQSGLREGDVIVKVEGTPIRTIAELRDRVQAASENGDNSVELEYLREKRVRKAMLRWNGAR